MSKNCDNNNPDEAPSSSPRRFSSSRMPRSPNSRRPLYPPIPPQNILSTSSPTYARKPPSTSLVAGRRKEGSSSVPTTPHQEMIDSVRSYRPLSPTLSRVSTVHHAGTSAASPSIPSRKQVRKDDSSLVSPALPTWKAVDDKIDLQGHMYQPAKSGDEWHMLNGRMASPPRSYLKPPPTSPSPSPPPPPPPPPPLYSPKTSTSSNRGEKSWTRAHHRNKASKSCVDAELDSSVGTAALVQPMVAKDSPPDFRNTSSAGGHPDTLQERVERKLHEEQHQELLAKQWQREMDILEIQDARRRRSQEMPSHDFLAIQLQQQLAFEDELERERLKEIAELEMESSAAGKAWKLVERVHELHRSRALSYGEQPVSVDDMVFLAERMFEAQEDFRRRGLPGTVDIGYHYTSMDNMARIRTDGLLSKAERDAKHIASHFNGEAAGPGIYTGNDPKTFQKYGSVGLIVARLKGKSMDFVTADRQYTRGNTSIVSNSLVVLEKSCQCLALLQFHRDFADDVMQAYAADLYAIIDEFFNKEEDPSPVLLARSADLTLMDLVTGQVNIGEDLESASMSRRGGGGAVHHQRAFRKHAELLHYTAPSSLDIGDLRGMMPSGSMYIFMDPAYTCAGSSSPGTIVIRYHIPAGVQQSYHENPGWEHNSTYREAYLPDNEMGRHLLGRLKRAFQHGLTFTVGTSVTTGQANSVVWSLIPHKTSLVGGPYGFPDPEYFMECHATLDALAVP